MPNIKSLLLQVKPMVNKPLIRPHVLRGSVRGEGG